MNTDASLLCLHHGVKPLTNLALSDQEIKREWSRASRLYGKGKSLSKRLALSIVDDLEKAGVTEADIDRISKKETVVSNEVKEYPQRNIEIGGRTVRCQVLNWNDGPPPRYIVCNALSSNDGIFFAEQRMGAWCKASERDVWFDFATMHKTITDIQTLLVDESLEPKEALDKIKAEVAAAVVLARLK